MIRKFCLTLAVITTALFSMVCAQQTVKVTASGIGYLEYLPDGYNSNTNQYPIVISLHGIKEKGTSSTDPSLVKAGVPRVANVGLPKYVKYGAKYPFILISPQLKSNYGTWPGSYVIEVLNYVKKYLRIDNRRIYLTGLSLGGYGVWKTVGDYPQIFAAIVPICPGGNALSKASAIAAQDVPAWGFHGGSDNIVSYTVTTKMIQAVNSCPERPNPLAKATIYAGLGHIIWDKVYKESNALNWMLTFQNGTTSSTTSNTAPAVSAGSDKTLTLPANSIYIQGTASDSDGSVASYKWTKVYGGAASLSATTSSKFRAYNLVAGTYVFRLTVKDNDGAVKSDDVKVTVLKASSTNVLPVVYAGPDRILTLPTNSLYIQGQASDKDGSIVSYQWTKTYGGKVSLSGATTSKVRIYNLGVGVYIYKLTVKDNDGGSKDDYFKITVKASTSGDEVAVTNPGSNSGNTSDNIPPVANAGSDREITGSSIQLTGSGTDRDGRIVSYQWKKLAGPAVTISNAKTPKPTINNLKEGHYYFSLTVKDNENATHVDKMLIRVYGG